MDLDFDTFLVALYTVVDDLYREHFAPEKPRRPGHKPEMSDGEVLSLLILAQWFGNSQRRVIRHAGEHWRAYFPRLLSQSAANRRGRDLAGVLVRLVPLVGARLGCELAPYQVLDGVPVPLMRKCRGKRGRLFGTEASVGRGGADRDFYYGCRLLISVTPEGAITGFVLGPARTGERWLMEGLLCWRDSLHGVPFEPDDLPPANKRHSSHYVGPTGPIWPREGVGARSQGPYIADGGLGGRAWRGHWQADYRVTVFTPEGYLGRDAEGAKAEHRAWRHVIETVNSHLEGALHLPFPKARGRWGLTARVAAKLVAFNLAIWINRLFGRPDFAVATIFS